MGIKIELLLIVLSILFFLSILSSKISSKFGVPALLLFLAVGMLSGSDGFGIEFENIQLANAIGTVALCIILFSGGMDTKMVEIRPVLKQGVLLATIGVILTAFIGGILVWFVFNHIKGAVAISLLTSLLLVSVMSSTDSASVFSILRSKGLHLKNNLRPMLELESGSNDPTAYILVITLIEIVKMSATPNYMNVISALIIQMTVGVISGYILGKLSVFIINRIKIDNDSLYPILVFTFCIFIFSFTYFIKGNSYLAVYIGGLVLGNEKFLNKRSSMNFFDGLTWISQLLVFLTLGLLVNPSELVPILIPGLIISFAMIFIARPVTVFLTLLPFRKMPVKDKVYISWVGLKGAVPIIFAIILLAENVPNARLIFNIVFLCTLVSLLVQGTSLPIMAKWLGLADKPQELNKLIEFDIELSEDIKSTTSEIILTENMIKNGNKLMNLSLPENTLVVLLKRNEKYIVPTGKTSLKINDVLLIITDDQEALLNTYKSLNAE
ncbi:MAG TPA: potassium/proton antiporter [Bacteroidaceae bacterium]|nr:potassium/proton antiporter [Bacteroidaceae bacterium]